MTEVEAFHKFCEEIGYFPTLWTWITMKDAYWVKTHYSWTLPEQGTEMKHPQRLEYMRATDAEKRKPATGTALKALEYRFPAEDFTDYGGAYTHKTELPF